MKTTAIVIQIIVCLALIALVLVQSRGTGLGDIFGGKGESYYTRRGTEKFFFSLTIATGGLFLLISIINAFFI